MGICAIVHDSVMHGGAAGIRIIRSSLHWSQEKRIADRDLVNRVIEINLRGETSVIREYEFPPQIAPDNE